MPHASALFTQKAPRRDCYTPHLNTSKCATARVTFSTKFKNKFSLLQKLPAIDLYLRGSASPISTDIREYIWYLCTNSILLQMIFLKITYKCYILYRMQEAMPRYMLLPPHPKMKAPIANGRASLSWFIGRIYHISWMPLYYYSKYRIDINCTWCYVFLQMMMILMIFSLLHVLLRWYCEIYFYLRDIYILKRVVTLWWREVSRDVESKHHHYDVTIVRIL